MAIARSVSFEMDVMIRTLSMVGDDLPYHNFSEAINHLCNLGFEKLSEKKKEI